MAKGLRFTRAEVAGLPPRLRDGITAALAAQAKTPPAVSVIEAAPNQRRVRQSRATLNKTEEAYQDVLWMQHGREEGKVYAQAISLVLSNGHRYKPDFWIPAEMLFVEVKGPHAYRGGFENLKDAARVHRWAKFILVWRVKGQWFSQRILP